jgi:hypothetical protein
MKSSYEFLLRFEGASKLDNRLLFIRSEPPRFVARTEWRPDSFHRGSGDLQIPKTLGSGASSS